jgi:hypothetical protein
MPSPESPAKRMTTSSSFSSAISRFSFSETVVLMMLPTTKRKNLALMPGLVVRTLIHPGMGGSGSPDPPADILAKPRGPVSRPPEHEQAPKRRYARRTPACDRPSSRRCPRSGVQHIRSGKIICARRTRECPRISPSMTG